MTDFSEYLDCKAAAKLLPGNRHPSTLWRWMTVGLPVNGTGRKVHLQHVRVGGTLCTTQAWLHEFFERLTGRETEASTNPQPASELQDYIADIAHELRKAGLK